MIVAEMDFAEFDLRAWSVSGLTKHVTKRAAQKVRRTGVGCLATLILAGAASGNAFALDFRQPTFVAGPHGSIQDIDILTEDIADPNTYWPNLVAEIRGWPTIAADQSKADIPSIL